MSQQMNIIKAIRRLFKNNKGIKMLIEEAQAFEAQKKYEDACYSYAGAIDQGEDDKNIRNKVRGLYKTYGSFKFEQQLERMKKEYCSSCESCGEGYHIHIVNLINKIAKE